MSVQICQTVAGWAMQVEVFEVIAFVLGIAAQTWGIVHFLLKRMDSHKEKVEDKLDAVRHTAEEKIDLIRRNTEIEAAHLHTRINEVKDTYVKRSDLDREFATLQRNLTDMKEDFHRGIAGVGQRLDQVVTLVSRKNPE